MRLSASTAGAARAANLFPLLVMGVQLVLLDNAAADVELRAPDQVVRVSTTGGLPVYWLSCSGGCERAGAKKKTTVGEGSGAMSWAADQPMDAEAMARVSYTAVVTESPEAVTAVLTSLDSDNGRPLVQRFELSRHTHKLRARLQAPPGVGLSMRTETGYLPEQLPGVGAIYAGADAVYITAAGQREISAPDKDVAEVAVERTAWMGIRAHFWAWLVQPGIEVAAVVDVPGPDQPRIIWRAPSGELDLTFYTGPVEWKALRVVSPALTQMLFAALWEPLRWLSYGLFFLLGFITRWVGNAGLGIILLSLAVKIVLWPLTRIAERWQRDVNRIQGRIQPRIQAIRRQYKGEDAHNRTLQVYKDEKVHPLFILKSLAGFAIQVPMFIAAFDMLADNFALSGTAFLWIADLAKPDRFAALPFAIPLLGSDFNLLPVVMTALTILSAVAQRDDSLTPALLIKQQRQLYLMAGGFFLLFYTFPAGMVLYWTANNLWHLLKMQLGRAAAAYV